MRIAIVMRNMAFQESFTEKRAVCLKKQLIRWGHMVDIVPIPFAMSSMQSIVQSLIMTRMIDLSESSGFKIDCVIALDFPGFYIQHEKKLIWLDDNIVSGMKKNDSLYMQIRGMENYQLVSDYINENNQRFLEEAKAIYVSNPNIKTRIGRNYTGLDHIIHELPFDHKYLSDTINQNDKEYTDYWDNILELMLE